MFQWLTMFQLVQASWATQRCSYHSTNSWIQFSFPKQDVAIQSPKTPRYQPLFVDVLSRCGFCFDMFELEKMTQRHGLPTPWPRRIVKKKPKHLFCSASGSEASKGPRISTFIKTSPGAGVGSTCLSQPRWCWKVKTSSFEQMKLVGWLFGWLFCYLNL